MEFLIKNALQQVDNSQPETEELKVGKANIKVIGCGGAGNNAVTWLFQKEINGAEIIAINTDAMHLNVSQADRKILIGRNLTRGLGAGGFPQTGTEAARESLQELREALKGADMVFVTAGMGGGTGTGAAPIVAKLATEMNSIVIGVVTMPFKMEKARIDKAEYGLKELRKSCDTVVVIDNNKLVEVAGNLPVQQAFAVANEIISTMIKSIVEVIAVPSLVNLDFADVRAIMTTGGVAAMGVGEADSERRVEEATQRALQHPLLHVTYDGATAALIHITGGPEMTLEEVNKVGEMVTSALDPEANVIFGARVDKEMAGRVRVMTIITGVKSPYLLGKDSFELGQRTRAVGGAVKINEELGLEMIY